MAQVVYSAKALSDLERAFDNLDELGAPDAAIKAVAAIRSAVSMLSSHPLIGRIATGDYRELVISFGRSGYVALYRYLPAGDRVRTLAIKHQRELGYPA